MSQNSNQDLYIDDKAVVIFTTKICPYCIKAKKLLEKKREKFKFDYEEIPLDGKHQMREALTQKTGGRKTVPQIFIRGKHIGGCDDLYALEAAGELDSKLNNQ